MNESSAHRPQCVVEDRAVYLLATLDTKGNEAAFLREQLIARGVNVRLVDVSCFGEARVSPDIARDELFAAAELDWRAIATKADRGFAVTAAAAGAAALVREAYAAGKLAGVVALGGSAGTTIGTAAMRALPLGVPKLMLSTLASGQVRHYVGDKDIVMLNSVVDLAGLNRVTRLVLDEAARAMAGLVLFAPAPASHGDRPLVAATMFGVTTPCVEQAKRVLEEAGYEVLVFHATGSGGQALESLIADGMLAGVLDITTTELADESVGGVLSAGPDRLTAAARHGVPQVVSVGATDMVNFHARASVPEKFRDRTFYQHNANVTLMRTTPAECSAIGADIGRKLAAATGPVAVYIPKLGVSAVDRQGQPFDDPAARQALVDALRAIAPRLEIVELDEHINDAEFATRAARRLIDMMQG